MANAIRVGRTTAQNARDLTLIIFIAADFSNPHAKDCLGTPCNLLFHHHYRIFPLFRHISYICHKQPKQIIQDISYIYRENFSSIDLEDSRIVSFQQALPIPIEYLVGKTPINSFLCRQEYIYSLSHMTFKFRSQIFTFIGTMKRFL